MNWSLVRLAVVVLAFLAEAVAAHAQVVINEIMYQGAGARENTAAEFIELHNTGPDPVDLSGWRFSKGISFTFPAGTTITGGGFLVVAPSVAAFQAANPGVANVVGDWTGTLSNSSEQIRLVNAGGQTVDEVTYADEGDWALRVRDMVVGGWAWTSAADGSGRSLELRNPAVVNHNGQNWGPSIAVGGTPGAANSILSTDLAPLISDVRHWPAVPRSTDVVTISCTVADEIPAGVAATLWWRVATSTQPGVFQSTSMQSGGHGVFTATLPAQANLTIVEFYVQASDGTNTRTWPAATSIGQNANCQYQVDDTPANSTDSFYRLVLTGAENAAFNSTASFNASSDAQFNHTLVVTRGGESTIRYRGSMRIRGNSSRNYQFKPMRISLPGDAPWEGVTAFNLNPRSPHLQYLGSRLFQAAGVRSERTIPVELRRNGLELTTSTGATPDFGKWARVEDLGDEMIDAQWPEANGGNTYKKRRPDRYWRNTGWSVPANADGTLDGWSKQNNAAANDWSDLTTFFAGVQSVTAPHFPGAPSGDSASSTGSPLSSIGLWRSTAFTAAEIATLEIVADLDQWARWFAVMTILQDLETNISNGEDDDYSIYFAPSANGQRRAQLVPHDLDTIFGLGDSSAAFNARGLYDMCETGSVFRPLLPLFGTSTVPGNTAFRSKYLTAIRELYGGIFNASTTGNPNPPFHTFVDNHLGGWVPAATLSAIKSFAASRQTFLLGLAGGGAITPAAGTSSATLMSPPGELMISELLARNAGAVNRGGLFPDLIELHNAGGTAADLSGCSLSDDPAVPRKYVFPAGTTIAPGGYLVLQADGGTDAGRLPFSLNDGGETVHLYDSPAKGGALLDSITFGAQPADFTIGRTGADLATWTLCTPTLGAANTPVTSFAPASGVRINEWLGNPDYQFDDDFLELHNPGTLPAAIGGMAVTDDFINYPARRALPRLSFMAPQSFLRFLAKGTGATPGDATELPFRIDGTFGRLALAGENGALVDMVDLVSQAADTSTGRSPDGGRSFARFGPPASLATPGASNTATPPANILGLMNGLRVTEILFQPDDLEFLELQNIGATALDLSGVHFTRGISYTFPAGTSLAPGAFIVVCKKRATFEARFGAAVPLAPGEFTGSLSDSGESIALQPPPPWAVNILNFFYDRRWLPTGAEPRSLTLNDPAATAAGDWDDRLAWAPSNAPFGTPGHAGPPTIISAMSASAVAGDAFRYQIVATKFPTSYAATPLPPGLSLDTATGLISGLATEAGRFEVTVSAVNSIGTETKALTLTFTLSGPHASFAWDAIASPQSIGVPFPARLRAVDAQGRTVPEFSGTANLQGPDGNTRPTIGTGTTTWNYPLYTYYHDARTQVIYLASELGGRRRITGLALDVTSLPGQVLNNWTIRVKHTALSSYTTIAWEGPASGWTIAVQRQQTISTTGWVEFTFAAPFDYDGTSNLMVDFSYNNSTYTTSGNCRYTTTNATRTIYGASDSGAGDPLTWSGTASASPTGINRIPNLRLTVESQAVTITPGVTGTFVNGVWTGFLTTAQAAANVTVRASDAFGNSGTSNAFTVVLVAPVIISPTRAVTVAGQPCSFQILATNSASGYGAVNLPAGLAVDAATGLITGTPVAEGTSTARLSAINSAGTGTGELVWEVQADADGDGIGDVWESSFGLDPANAADAALDLDSDGQSNLAEWRAGTTPNDAGSRLTMLAPVAVGPDVQLAWTSAVGKRYRVSASTNLTAGVWTVLTPAPLVATELTTRWTHTGGRAGSARYYRVELVP